MRRDYLIAILLAVAAIPAGATLMVAPDYLHLTGVAVPLTFWGGIALTLSLIAVAAWMALRGTKKDSKLRVSPFSNTAHDVPLLDAIWRVSVGEWGKRETIPHGEIGRNTARVKKFVKSCIEIRQRAFEGKLPIWACRKGSLLLEPLPLDYWLNRDLLCTIMMGAEWNETWVNFTHALVPGEVRGFRSEEWGDFLTNRERVDTLWPPDKEVKV